MKKVSPFSTRCVKGFTSFDKILKLFQFFRQYAKNVSLFLARCKKVFSFFSQDSKSFSFFLEKAKGFSSFFGQYVKTIRYFLLFYNFSGVFSNMCAKINQFF